MKELLIEDISKLPFELKDIYRLLSHSVIGMSWGIHKPSLYKDTVLAFKVKGFLHKGWVYIFLEYDDTFSIVLTKSNRTTIVKDITNVYIEDLINTLDRYIEKNSSDKSYSKMIYDNYSLV